MITFLGISCSQQKDSGSASRNMKSTSQSDSELENKKDKDATVNKKSTQEPAITKINPKDLFVSRLRVGTYENKKIVNEVISYEIDGRADYVSYKICPLEITNQKCEGANCAAGGECIENIYTLNRVILPVMRAGQIEISVKACVEKDRSLDATETCGKPQEIIYNSHRYDEEVERMLLDKERIISQLDKLETDFRFALETYTTEANECIKNDAAVEKLLQSKLKFVDLIIKAPFGWMGSSAKVMANNLATGIQMEDEFKSVGESASAFKSAISDFLSDSCDSMGEKTCGVLRTVGETGKMFAHGFNPVHSIGLLSNAIHDLTAKSDELVKRNCHADENFQQRQDAIERYWLNSVDRLNKIKTTLQEKGYL